MQKSIYNIIQNSEFLSYVSALKSNTFMSYHEYHSNTDQVMVV